MRPVLRLPMLIVSITTAVVLGACAEQAAETSPGAASPSASEATASPSPSGSVEPSEGPTEEPTPSPSTEPLAACDLVLADIDGPEGSQAGEPRHQTLDDLRAEAEEAPEGPAREAAEANVEAYEEMGLVERCAIRFNGAAAGDFSSTALVFEDDSGPAEYVDWLMIGCEAAALPATASADATAIACNSAGLAVTYLVVTSGTVAQALSAQPTPGGTFDPAAALEQAAQLIEAVPEP